MRIRLARLLLCLPVSAFAGEPLLLDPGEWADAAGVMRLAVTAMEEPVVTAAGGDLAAFPKFAATVEVLAVTAVRTGNLTFANRAGDWLRAWLVDPATRVDPTLRGGAGVADLGREMIRVVDAVRILEGSGALDEAETHAVRGWFGDRYTSLGKGDLGEPSGEATDHRATLLLLEAFTLAAHLDDEPDLPGLCDRAKALIAAQVGADGSQPREIAGTDGLRGSIQNLEAHLQIALLALRAHEDLWNFVPESGRGLKQALDYLRPFNAAPGTWSHNQAEKVAPGSLDRALRLAGRLDASIERE